MSRKKCVLKSDKKAFHSRQKFSFLEKIVQNLLKQHSPREKCSYVYFNAMIQNQTTQIRLVPFKFGVKTKSFKDSLEQVINIEFNLRSIFYQD